ncbi:hypothetical protein D1871_22910 [Nakamurella silvestris]|nr:hypothetical protein D1871_22910 [Nakamurella silvestris]
MKALPGSRQLTLVLCSALVAVVVLGLGAGFLVGRHQASASGGGDPTEITSVPDTPSPSPGAYDTDVRIGESAAKDRRAEKIRDLLQRYFDGINTRNYAAWATTVNAQQAADRPQEQWEVDYSTTHDYDIEITDITTTPFRVGINFTSKQDIAFAPVDLPSECIKWDVFYNLLIEDGKLVVGRSATTLTRKSDC